MSPPDTRLEPGFDPPAPGRAAPPPPPPPRKPERRRRRRPSLFGGVFRFLFTLAMVAIVAGGVAAFGLYRHIAADLPDYRWLADYQPPQMSRIYAADSRLMAELAAERRVFMPIEAIPKLVQAAFVSAEDQRFWEHHGIDPRGILRAIITNIEQYGTGRRMGGASTITQQVAKNMLVGNDRTLLRKAREAILAIRIEEALPKERILELYLNEIFLGYQAFGVAAAAQAYFNKGLDELSLGEIAFLGALPKAPNNYNPVRYPEAARARRDWVLDRMAEDGAITAEQAAAAKQEPIVPRMLRRPETLPVGQYFTEEVRRELLNRFGPEQTTMGGLVVRTSIEPALQKATEQVLRNGLVSYDRRRGGWRGAITRISAGSTDWMPQLEAVQRPGGVLPEWKLAVVLEVRPGEAKLGWIERPDSRSPAQPRTGILPFDGLAWARKALGDGRFGGRPSRMQDILSPGDVVPIEVTAPGAGGRPDRLALRQVPQIEGAIVALDPQTGRVLAMAGGWSFDKSQFNRATQAQRQPGSSFKPFVYLPALEAGVPPTQRFLDGPIEVMTPQGVWRPSNYTEGSYNGYVSIRTALQKSLNLVTIRVAQEVGMAKVSETAARFGVIDNMPRYLAMSLGSGETTVLRMAAGYAGFASGGRKVTPTFIDSVQDRRGRVIWRSDARACEGCDAPRPGEEPPELVDARPQIADPIAVYQMTNILTGVVQRGTGTAAGKGLDRPIAGKTGTTNDYVDNWFVGYTPDIVIAVWLGFDDPHSLGKDETGGHNAAPVFRDVLQAALGNSPPVPFRAPPGVALVRMQDGNATIMEAFRPGTENSARRVGGETASGSARSEDQNLGGLY
ncbi:penicillin-binding protein 1A [Roseicella sp. DB1501]|uniref:penicillin-binding protein 1A n=1 Tax=Roseicella sp. DB1501 TaxID=2730925 RepID=UPI0014918EDE|nr:PBP1A family penicillin-binding protein [Roseicella sp. DB1501]NOG74207.1 PBP1A family penicillin-binding protein [Roseicella sp. DB1501]